jgi:hypothetical protein
MNKRIRKKKLKQKMKQNDKPSVEEVKLSDETMLRIKLCALYAKPIPPKPSLSIHL